MSYFLIGLYLLPLLFLFGYSLMQLSLIIQHFRYDETTHTQTATHFLQVTIQLPLYNEKYVAERLIDNIVKMDYPWEKLEIQILDDSTDETSEIIEESVLKYAAQGLSIIHIRRDDRVGFKAGALKYGLELAKGDLIAIFDADFLPNADFLKRTVPYFENASIGVVQTRWGHLNKSYSLLTQLQAFGLDAHFMIEQTGRNAANHFINFNGTAGIWRKSTIYDAGNWSADTLTEDLDLSYRAQLKGWKFAYLRDVVAPAELPITMPAIRSQQYRWMKGGAECFVKNVKKIRTSDYSLGTKFHGIFHLLNSSIFIAVLLSSLMSIGMVLGLNEFILNNKWIVAITGVFQLNWLILATFYWLAFKENNGKFIDYLRTFIPFLILMMGLSLHNSIAVIEGLIGRKTPFIRTPKFNISKKDTAWTNTYSLKKLNKITYVEMAIAATASIALLLEIKNEYWGLIPYHLMLFLGYTAVSIISIKHSLLGKKAH